MKSLKIENLILWACVCAQLFVTGPAWKLKLNQACICADKALWRLPVLALESQLCLGIYRVFSTACSSAEEQIFMILIDSMCEAKLVSYDFFCWSLIVVLPLRFHLLGALFTFILIFSCLQMLLLCTQPVWTEIWFVVALFVSFTMEFM